MDIRKILVLATGCLWSVVTWANVTYVWQTVSTSDTIWMVKGELEITDSARAAGQINYNAPDSSGPGCYGSVISDPCPGDPTSPIVRFLFAVNGPALSTVFSNNYAILLQPTASYPMDFFWQFNVTLNAGSLTSGMIFAVDGIYDIGATMSSTAGVWTITKYGDPYECWSPTCSGATGIWRRVPEPGMLTLLGIGLAGLAGSRRNRRLAA